MKTNSEIRKMLGLSQKEIAKLLGVSLSQWAMYEIGQRDIPLSGMKKIGEVLGYLQHAIPEKGEEFVVVEKQKEQQWVEQEYAIQSHKLELVHRNILSMEHQRTKCFQALTVLGYLEQFPDDISAKDLALDIRERVEENLSKNSSSKLQELYLKKESTELLKNKLAEKIVRERR